MADFFKDIKLNKQDVGKILTLNDDHVITSSEHSVEDITIMKQTVETTTYNVSAIDERVEGNTTNIENLMTAEATTSANLEALTARVGNIEQQIDEALLKLQEINGKED